MQPMERLRSRVSQNEAEVWKVRKSQKLDTPVASANPIQCHHVSWGRKGQRTQNINTLEPAANLDRLVGTDNSQYKEDTN